MMKKNPMYRFSPNTPVSGVRHAFTNRQLFCFIAILLCFSLTLSLPAQAKKKNKDKVKVKVLQNEEYNECMFMGEVVIRVKYTLKTLDYAALTAELTHDGLSYYETTSLDIERGKGKVMMSFDAGDCATGMRVVIK